MPAARQWPLGTVGVMDSSGFVKRGSERVGVARQWCRRLGKKENCQMGVFLLGVTLAGTADGEARSWTNWHHHMGLVALAHLYLVLNGRLWGAKSPS